MGSAETKNLLAQTTTDGGDAATHGEVAVKNLKNSPKTGLYYFFYLCHYGG
jgi:hypothetical protein